eukprot:Hpha_TRINITY_DN15575_c1_g1::TRINITY_DN15575_c1_g1_i1::g.105631::m.105631/K14376/PAP; poly(A) polymerase
MSAPVSPLTPAQPSIPPPGPASGLTDIPPADADGGTGGPEAIPTSSPPPEALLPELKSPPTQKEEEMDRRLRVQLHFTVESPKAGERRGNVLQRLEKLLKTWVLKLLAKKGFQVSPEDPGGRILTFGSYRLGVHFPGSDIDTLCLAPREVDRDDFFDTLVSILRKHILVSELNPVREAHVPVIKMKFDGVPIDLVFCALNADRLPPPAQFDLLADSLLRGLDDPSQRSLNGSRVAEKLLECVPHPETFRWVLRGVKLWARNRGIYGNIYGFPGGVAWAILTAKVCQLYPNATAAGLLRAFFRYYSVEVREEGPNRPVYLTKTLDVPAEFSSRNWDRKNSMFELLPVITPAVPFMNSCYNLNRTNLRILCNEFRRGDEVLTAMTEDPAVSPSEMDFDALWAPSDFFIRYKVFMQVEVSASDAVAFGMWSSYVESKIRHLVTSLETWPQYAGLHDQRQHAGKGYSADIRVWPFMFREESEQRLVFDRAAAVRQMQLDDERPPAPAATAPAAAAPAPKKPEEVAAAGGEKGAAGAGTEAKISGYFFIGLGTYEPEVLEGKCRQMIDFEGAVENFQQSLYTDVKTPAMNDPRIVVVRRRELPDWVLMDSEREHLAAQREQYRIRKEQRRAWKAERRRIIASQMPVSPDSGPELGDAPTPKRPRVEGAEFSPPAESPLTASPPAFPT